jgi:glycosyltransferase involved in cell wall biosynthesis
MTRVALADTPPPAQLPGPVDGPNERRTRAHKLLSVVAPMFNEAEGLSSFFDRIRVVLDRCQIAYEIICVDDGSRDATAALVQTQRRIDPRVKLIRLARNFGKDNALTAGLAFARGDVVVPIDADLQDPPELIEAFLEQWEAGYDVVYGVRDDRSSDTVLKRMTAGGFYRVFNSLSNTAIPADTGDFRLLDRRVVEALNALPERNRFMKGLFAWVGFEQTGVPYVRPAREAGTSSWRYWKLWNFAIDAITSFSSWPLRMWSYLGLAVSGLAFIYAFAIIVRTLIVGRDAPGYASIMVTLLFFSGLQMLALGVLGEYVGRLYSEIKGRPLYLVSQRLGFD